MSYKELYTIRKADETKWIVYKVDRSTYEPTGQYEVTRPVGGHYFECHCFAGNKPTCRHRQIVELYEEGGEFKDKIDGGYKWDHDKSRWIAPMAVDV